MSSPFPFAVGLIGTNKQFISTYQIPGSSIKFTSSFVSNLCPEKVYSQISRSLLQDLSALTCLQQCLNHSDHIAGFAYIEVIILHRSCIELYKRVWEREMVTYTLSTHKTKIDAPFSISPMDCGIGNVGDCSIFLISFSGTRARDRSPDL